MEYRGAANIWNIARTAEVPLIIDPLSLKKTGPYSRILVDVDCSVGLPERMLIQRKSDSHEFYTNLFYEFVHFTVIVVALEAIWKIIAGEWGY